MELNMISDVILKNPYIDNKAIALKTSKEDITYGMLQERIVEFAGYLVSKGCGVGKKVIIWLNNSPDLIISYFAINLVGDIAILVDTKFKHEIYDIIQDNNVELIITDSVRKEQLIKFEDITILVVEDQHFKYEQTNAFEQYLENLNLDENQMSTILYTSGSTGKPKAVLNTHKNLQEALKNYTDTLDFTSEDKFIGVVPFFHSYAFDSCMLAALSCGAMLILISSFIPSKVLRIIQEERATVFHGVPFMYRLILEQLKTTTYHWDSIRLCISAGSRLEENCSREFYAATNRVIHQEYGSTETGTIAINLCSDIEKAIKYVGQPLKHVNLELIPYEATGEAILKVISKGMAIGYLGEEPFNRNGFLTQDLCVTEEGYLWMKGRADRLINITGLKVNPIEVEKCLKEHPDIIDVYVKGTVSEDFGEAVEAIIVRKNDNLTIKEVVTYCKQNLAAYKVPSIITWVKELGKSGLGKTRYL